MMRDTQTSGPIVAAAGSEYSAAMVVYLEPTPDQIDRLQQIAYWGHSLAEIAQQIGTTEAVLRRWSERHDEVGDALKVSQSIHLFRSKHEPEDANGR